MYKLVDWQYQDESGLLLRGRRTEPRGLPVIFFLHGNGLCGMCYWPMLRLMCDQYDVVMLDAAGHGSSDAPDGFQGWETNAESCYRAWLSLATDYSKVKKHACGHSFGGVLCTIIMAEYPETFDSAVLLDPVYFSPTLLIVGRLASALGLFKYHKLARLTKTRRDRWPNLQSVREHFLAKKSYASWDNKCLEAYIEHGFKIIPDGVGLLCARELEAVIYASMPYRLPHFVRRMQTPCVIYSGDRSYGFVVSALPRYCREHKFIEHRQISGSHNFALEKNQQTANWIMRSLQQDAVNASV